MKKFTIVWLNGHTQTQHSCESFNKASAWHVAVALKRASTSVNKCSSVENLRIFENHVIIAGPHAEDSGRELLMTNLGFEYKYGQSSDKGKCMSPYCECPEGQCKYGLKDMRADQAAKDFPKPQYAPPCGQFIGISEGPCRLPQGHKGPCMG